MPKDDQKKKKKPKSKNPRKRHQRVDSMAYHPNSDFPTGDRGDEPESEESFNFEDVQRHRDPFHVDGNDASIESTQVDGFDAPIESRQVEGFDAPIESTQVDGFDGLGQTRKEQISNLKKKSKLTRNKLKAGVQSNDVQPIKSNLKKRSFNNLKRQATTILPTIDEKKEKINAKRITENMKKAGNFGGQLLDKPETDFKVEKADIEKLNKMVENFEKS